MKRKVRILVVDDHPMIRDGVKRLINGQSDLDCCGEAASESEALAAMERLKADLVILDLRLGTSDGFELIKTLKVQHPALRILVLSQYDSQLCVERALRAGAMGYVVKEQAAEEILTAVRTVLAGQIYLTRAMAAIILHHFVGAGQGTNCAGFEQLTDRELHVLQLLGAGMSTRQIAAEVKRSFKTIETHRENIKRKLGIHNSDELVHYASQWAQQAIPVPPDDSPAPVNRSSA